MSSRSAFLAGMARRRVDDSDSDVHSGCEDSDWASGDESEEVTPPRSYRIAEEMGTPEAKDVLLSVTPPDRAAGGSALLRRTSRGNERARPQQAKAKSAAKALAPPSPPTKIVTSSSPLLRRAESHRRRSREGGQENKTGSISKRATSNTPPRIVRSTGFDTRHTPPRSKSAHHARAVLELPSDLKSSHSSSFEGEDDISLAASVMSTASLQSALSLGTAGSSKSNGTSEGKPPQSGRAARREQRRLSGNGRRSVGRDEHGSGGGSEDTPKKSNQRSRSCQPNKDDSTVETASLSGSYSRSHSYSYSISHSKSSESGSSKQSMASKELDRLKRLSIGGAKSSDSFDEGSVGGSVATSEGYEVSIAHSKSLPNRSSVSDPGDLPQSRSEEIVSPKSGSRLAELNRLKSLKSISPKNCDKKAPDKDVRRFGEKRGRARRASQGRLAKTSSGQDEMQEEVQSRMLSRLRHRASSTLVAHPTLTASPNREEVEVLTSTSNTQPSLGTKRSSRGRSGRSSTLTSRHVSRIPTPKKSDYPKTGVSSLMRSTHRHRQSFEKVNLQEAARKNNSKYMSRSLTPHRSSNHFDVLKPSKLASLSIGVLSKAVVPIQNLARQYVAKLAVEARRKNVVVMQSLIRRWRCVTHYNSARRIALGCQGAYRGMIARDRLDYEHYCASRIQAALRGFTGYLSFLESLSKIILIQSIIRMQIQRRRYHKTIRDQIESEAAATKIQSCWRRHLASEYFIFVLSDVIVCQSAVRRKIAMRRYDEMQTLREDSATVIQKIFRGYSEQTEYAITVSDIIVSQSAARRLISRRELQSRKQLRWAEEFMKKEAAATKIQAAFVGYSTRMEYLISISDIITCQCEVRKMLAKRELEKLRHEQRERAATKIRAAYLAYLAKMEFIITVSDVITVQSAARGMIARRKLESLRQIQSAKEARAATTIRAAYLSYTARLNYIFTIADVITIQKCVRGYRARVMAGQMKQSRQEERAAIMIQKTFRGFQAYEGYVVTLANTMLCQAIFRQFLAKKELARRKHHRKINQSATSIQTQWRSFKAQTDYAITIWGIVLSQAIVRRFLAKKELARRKHHRKINQGATTIQTQWRSFKAQTDYALTIWGIISLQSLVRCRLQVFKYKALQWHRANESATRLQSIWRSYKAQMDYALATWGIISFQSLVRGHLDVRKYEQVQRRRMSAAVTIQSAFRAHIQYSDFITMIVAAISIQSCYRMSAGVKEKKRRAENRAQIEAQAATRIQSCFRGYQAFVRYLMIDYSVLQIQTCVRGYQARCHLQRLKDEERNGETPLHHAAATAIQTSFRGYRDFVQYVIMQYFIINIQAVTRGYLAKCAAKRLKQFELEKKRNRRLSNTISKARRKPLPLQKNRIPSVQERRQKKAALVIERFFINIKAEIELEMSRLEQGPPTPKHKSEMKRGNKKNTRGRRGVSQGNMSAYSFNGSGSQIIGSQSGGSSTAPGMAPSPHGSAPHGRQGFHNAVFASPSRQRMPSFQSSTDIRSASPSRGQSLFQSANCGHVHHPYPHPHAMRNASPARGRMPQRDHGMRSPSPSMRSASPSRALTPERMPSQSDFHPGVYKSAPHYAHMQSPSPSGYVHPPHPNCYTPLGNNMIPQGTQGLQSNSFSSGAPHMVPNSTHQPHQMHGLPSSRSMTMQQMPNHPMMSSHQSVSNTDQHAQHQMR